METCADCGKEGEQLFEYKKRDLCTGCVTQAAKRQPKYADVPRHSIDRGGKCDNCGVVYSVLVPGKFGDDYCIPCLSTRYLERGEAYRLAIWNSYFLAHGGH